MKILDIETKPIIIGVRMTIHMTRKINWEVMFELLDKIVITGLYCIEYIDLWDKSNKRIPLLDTVEIETNVENFNQFKKLLKEEVDLRFKYKWDMKFSDYDENEIRLLYDPFVDNRIKSMFDVRFTGEPDNLEDLKKIFAKVDLDDM